MIQAYLFKQKVEINTGCKVLIADAKVRISGSKFYHYPDGIVILNPVAIPPFDKSRELRREELRRE
ncbi:MAG TPA: hypothetical protein DCF68_10280 [Cyanothece sp. UBA12306]|nr:hypothetical protein [Cyanothece sp. UBA12306]